MPEYIKDAWDWAEGQEEAINQKMNDIGYAELFPNSPLRTELRVFLFHHELKRYAVPMSGEVQS